MSKTQELVLQIKKLIKEEVKKQTESKTMAAAISAASWDFWLASTATAVRANPPATGKLPKKRKFELQANRTKLNWKPTGRN